jgi:acyl-CoA dehydrogenase
MTDSALLEPFVRMLENACSPDVVRAIDAGGDDAALWAVLSASGFLDAMVPQAAGGAGLSLNDITPLLIALGRYAVPVPVAETMMARALLAEAGLDYSDGPITVKQQGSELVFGEVRLAAPQCGWRAIAATIAAAAISGAAERVLDMTVAYANDRVQFGKPIGKQQAVQQQLALMAELTIACRIAAQTACAERLLPDYLKAAMAKQVTSEAASQIANIAHAVHGAIGISADYDLQLYTRRLHAWRLADGSESYWAREIGRVRLGAAQSSVDFCRTQLNI